MPWRGSMTVQVRRFALSRGGHPPKGSGGGLRHRLRHACGRSSNSSRPHRLCRRAGALGNFVSVHEGTRGSRSSSQNHRTTPSSQGRGGKGRMVQCRNVHPPVQLVSQTSTASEITCCSSRRHTQHARARRPFRRQATHLFRQTTRRCGAATRSCHRWDSFLRD